MVKIFCPTSLNFTKITLRTYVVRSVVLTILTTESKQYSGFFITDLETYLFNRTAMYYYYDKTDNRIRRCVHQNGRTNMYSYTSGYHTIIYYYYIRSGRCFISCLMFIHRQTLWVGISVFVKKILFIL